jgi:hypothetical protein
MTPINAKGGTEQVPPAAQPGGNEKINEAQSRRFLVSVFEGK